MTDTPVFQTAVGASELERRRLHCETMTALGYKDFVVQAQGAAFLVGTTDLIDRSIAYYGIWEGPQLNALAEICTSREVDCFLDIGANLGFYSVMLATKGLVKEVVAFEPDPGNFAHLMANLYLNGLAGKVRALQLAAGREAGEVMLSQAGEWNRGESWIVHPDKPPEEAPAVATHRVRQVRFDDEIAISDKTIVMKMDVEGSEFHSLAGMQRTLRKNRCYAQVELYSNRFEDLKAVFAELGYRYLRTDDIDHFFTNIEGLG